MNQPENQQCLNYDKLEMKGQVNKIDYSNKHEREQLVNNNVEESSCEEHQEVE